MANAARAGVANDIEFSQRALSAAEPPRGAGASAGLLVSNPPYGVRVGEKEPLRDLFARLGQVARERFGGWQVALLSADPELESHVGLRFEERIRTSNGGIPVRLVCASVLR
jgi:23S rRNA G2445 N2-methylase RlmL